MVGYFLTLLVFLLFFGNLLLRSKRDDSVSFFSKDFTTVLKGLACLVVIYVHVPEAYQNPVQRMILSFGYVGVTIFFLISAYGMQLSVEKSKTYLKTFWRNRLVSLLIPTLLVNILDIALRMGILHRDFSVNVLIYICGYVKVLLAYCLWFFIVELLRRKIKKDILCDVLLIAGVFGSSLFDYFTNIGVANSSVANWPFERMGLVWGLLLYRFRKPVANFFANKQLKKTIILLIVSLVMGVAYLKFKHIVFWGEYLLKISLGFAIIAFTLCSSYGFALKGKVCMFIGGISFEIYLIHEITMRVLANTIKGSDSGVFIILTVAITIALATIINKIGKPLVKLGRSK